MLISRPLLDLGLIEQSPLHLQRCLSPSTIRIFVTAIWRDGAQGPESRHHPAAAAFFAGMRSARLEMCRVLRRGAMTGRLIFAIEAAGARP